MDLRLALNLGSLAHLDYETQLRTSSQAGFMAVGLRMDRLEEYLSSGHTADDAKRCLRQNHLVPVEANFFADWIYAKGRALQEAMRRAERYCSIMEKIECPILVATTACDGEHDHALSQDNFGELCNVAAHFNVMIALEFLPWTPVNTIGKAWKIVDAVSAPNGGITLDTFHYFKGEPRAEDLYEVPVQKIFIFHLDDVERVDADVITLCRNYRVPPGEGIFVFDEILEYLFKSGYTGFYSLEILNKDNYLQNPLELSRRAKLSAEKLLTKYARNSLK